MQWTIKQNNGESQQHWLRTNVIGFYNSLNEQSEISSNKMLIITDIYGIPVFEVYDQYDHYPLPNKIFTTEILFQMPQF